jgi:hypothetical protein
MSMTVVVLTSDPKYPPYIMTGEHFVQDQPHDRELNDTSERGDDERTTDTEPQDQREDRIKDDEEESDEDVDPGQTG